jgi:hypothetical protein
MTPMDRDLGYLWDMHDAAGQIREFAKKNSKVIMLICHGPRLLVCAMCWLMNMAKLRMKKFIWSPQEILPASLINSKKSWKNIMPYSRCQKLLG